MEIEFFYNLKISICIHKKKFPTKFGKIYGKMLELWGLKKLLYI